MAFAGLRTAVRFPPEVFLLCMTAIKSAISAVHARDLIAFDHHQVGILL
jgi:hypothetical protein